MFDAGSRYAKLATARTTREDGRTIQYVTRRFLPRGDTLPLLTEVTVSGEDRLDLLTNRTLGVPEAFWLVCDANDTMNPAELLDENGLKIRVPLPQP